MRSRAARFLAIRQVTQLNNGKKTAATDGFDFLGWNFLVQKNGKFRSRPSVDNFKWIRQGMTRAIAQQARTIRLPIHVKEKLNKIKKTQRELSQKLKRSVTTSEVAQVLDMSSEEIRNYLQIAKKTM